MNRVSFATDGSTQEVPPSDVSTDQTNQPKEIAPFIPEETEIVSKPNPRYPLLTGLAITHSCSLTHSRLLTLTHSHLLTHAYSLTLTHSILLTGIW